MPVDPPVSAAELETFSVSPFDHSNPHADIILRSADNICSKNPERADKTSHI